MKLKLLSVFKFFFAFNIFFCFSIASANDKSNRLNIEPNIVLLKDINESNELISSLNNFLIFTQNSNEENKFILESEKIETLLLLDKINGIEKSEKFKDDFFYKPYLTNIVSINEGKYLIQISYIGINEDKALLKACFSFIAQKEKNKFVFSSPLRKNAEKWKINKIGNVIFHYADKLNKKRAKEFSEISYLFDKKLKSKNKVTEFYCTENIIELNKLIGVEYILDENGIKEGVTGTSFNNKILIILGNNNANFNNFDPHDLWHERLSLVVSRNKVNKAVDEGCAYLYGGSWGLHWKDIFKEFKKQITINQYTNWVEIKENPIFFKTNGFNNSVDYIINALLIKKIEQDKGFAGVWELLNSGRAEKGNLNYYKTLEKLTGINKENYNNKILDLITNEK